MIKITEPNAEVEIAAHAATVKVTGMLCVVDVKDTFGTVVHGTAGWGTVYSKGAFAHGLAEVRRATLREAIKVAETVEMNCDDEASRGAYHVSNQLKTLLESEQG